MLNSVPSSNEDVSAILNEIADGNDPSQRRLMPLVYDELRRLAASCLRDERSDHTLQPTALVHEAYVHLIKQRKRNWPNKAVFLQVAAQMMRRVLVDHARQHDRVKRGGGLWHKVSLDGVYLFSSDQASELLVVDESLNRLAEEHPRPAQVVELRFYGGLTVDEAAKVLDISPKTVKRESTVARAWLYGDLKERYGIDTSSAGNGE
jgi:RNA polymerase sigma-70 factor, ECF subfamily